MQALTQEGPKYPSQRSCPGLAPRTHGPERYHRPRRGSYSQKRPKPRLGLLAPSRPFQPPGQAMSRRPKRAFDIRAVKLLPPSPPPIDRAGRRCRRPVLGGEANIHPHPQKKRGSRRSVWRGEVLPSPDWCWSAERKKKKSVVVTPESLWYDGKQW
jgi:hypothetical protein